MGDDDAVGDGVVGDGVVGDRVVGDREQLLVELVDDDGRACGSATVAEAHRAPGLAHRAFSVMLTDARGRLLLQQRAASKTRFALCWANATCGHPGPGQDVLPAGADRLAAELGLTGSGLVEVGVFRYRAADPATAFVEHEHDHVLAGEADPHWAGDPDPTEVADLCWITPADLAERLRARPGDHAPWLAGVLETWGAPRA